MKRFHIAASALLVGVLALAGCGGDDGDGGGKVKKADLPTLSGKTVKVGVIGPFDTVAFGNPQPELRSAAMAAADAINKRGGIHGGKLEVVACDDGYDPNKATECARKLVKDGVIAIVGSQTITFPAYGPIVKAAGIPVIGALPMQAEDFQDLNTYPIATGGVGLFAGDVIAAKMAGKKSVSMIGLSAAGGEAQAGLVKGIADAVGIDFKGYNALPTDSSDLTPAVKAAEKSGADVIIMSLDKVATRQFMVAAQSVGAKFTLAHSPEAVTPEVLKAAPKAAEGMLLASPFPPYADTSFAGLKQYNEEMDARAKLGDKGADDSNRQTVLVTWVGFRAFEEISKLVKGDVTPQALQQALKSAKGIDFGLGFKWSPSERNSPTFKALSYTDGYISTVKDGKIVLMSKDPVPVLGSLGG
ncbi:MAG TPA: ABC transporter substrate-binding protein [Nocardioides sp.]|nr:ABC transporter substrate-binding protein [Nocardioides sp.]